MPSDVHLLVPAIPSLVVPAAVAFAILLGRLARRGALTVPRVLLAIVLCVYGVGVLRSVLVPFGVLLGHSRDHLAPLGAFVQLVPLVTADPEGIALNVLLFVPLGLLAPLLLRRPTLFRVLVVAAVTSLGIETVQLLLDATISTGRVADVDDLIGNTAGGLIGFALFRAAMLVPPLARAAAAARWPRESDGGGGAQSSPSASGSSPRRRTLSTR